MKQKRTKEQQLEIAKRTVRRIILYFNITRVVNSQFYKVDGKFSMTKYLEEMKFLSTWNKRCKEAKRDLAGKYAEYSKHFNLVQGIPSKLLEQARRRYEDADGITKYIATKEILEELVKEGFIRPLDKQPKAGRKFKKNKESGEFEVKAWWNNKYLMANEKYQYRLLADKRYGSYRTFPWNLDDKNDEVAFYRFKKIISKFEGNIGKKHEKVEKKVEQPVEKFMVRPKSNPTVDSKLMEKAHAVAKALNEKMNKREITSVQAVEVFQKMVPSAFLLAKFKEALVKNGMWEKYMYITIGEEMMDKKVVEKTPWEKMGITKDQMIDDVLNDMLEVK